MSSPRVLIVGAGAVGQVYGYHLQKGGAEVTFYVKPKYLETTRKGLTLYPLKGPEKGQQIEFKDFSVLSTVAEVAVKTWDQVWLCISATALRGPWLDPFLKATGTATIVNMTPGLEDETYLLERLPAKRLCMGLITMVSYQTPLPGEQVSQPGIAYWWPPMTKNPFSGERVKPVVSTLNTGQWPSVVAANTREQLALGSSIMMPCIAGLEASDWVFKKFRKAENLDPARTAARQAVRMISGGKLPLMARMLSTRTALRLILRYGQRYMPMNLEVYLKYHFTKVGDQTRAQLANYVRLGEAQNQPRDALETLATRLSALDPKAEQH